MPDRNTVGAGQPSATLTVAMHKAAVPAGRILSTIERRRMASNYRRLELSRRW